MCYSFVIASLQRAFAELGTHQAVFFFVQPHKAAETSGIGCVHGHIGNDFQHCQQHSNSHCDDLSSRRWHRSITFALKPRKADILSRNLITKLSDRRFTNSVILLPTVALQTLRPISRKRDPRILHSMAGRILERRRLSSEIRVRAEEHWQLRAVESA
jgi:hypothetical protein